MKNFVQTVWFPFLLVLFGILVNTAFKVPDEGFNRWWATAVPAALVIAGQFAFKKRER